jgi:4-carboxymuconolactone decarboxylase
MSGSTRLTRASISLYDNRTIWKGKHDMTDAAGEALETLFQEGLSVRREVLGKDYVDGSLARADDFMMAFQRITTEWCWGYAWTRPGLDRKTRSIINLAMLTALGKPAELKLHVAGALRNGVTPDEVKEVLLQATVYCGIPAGLEAFKTAAEVLKAAEGNGGAPA